MAAFKVPTSFTARDRFSGSISKMESNLRGFAKRSQVALARTNRRLRSMRNNLNRVNTGLSSAQQAMGGFLAVAGGAQVVRAIDNYAKLNSQVQTLFDVGSDKADKYAGKVEGMAAAYGEQKSSILQSANALQKNFDVSIQESFNLLDEGFKKGADSQQEFMKMMREYPSIMGQTNMSAESLMATITSTQKMGIFDDKGIDALKEGMITLREMPGPAREAINALDLDPEGISEDIRSGEYMKAMRKVSGAMNEAGKNAPETGKALKAIFAGPGEDAGKFLFGLEKIPDSMSEIEDESSGPRKAIREMQHLWGRLKVVLVKALIPAFMELIDWIKPVAKWMSNNEDSVRTLVKVLLWLVAAFVAVRVAVVAFTAAMGITSAIYKVVTAVRAWTLGQWSLNAAMAANPIGLLTAAIIALTATTTVAVKKWDQWGAALSIAMGPLGMILNMIMTLHRHWSKIQKGFTEGGIIGGLKAIGVAIFDMLLYPMQQLFELMNKTGIFGDLGEGAVKGIKQFRENLGATTEGEEDASGDGGNGGQNNEVASMMKWAADTQRQQKGKEGTRNELDINLKGDAADRAYIEKKREEMKTKIKNERTREGGWGAALAGG